MSIRTGLIGVPRWMHTALGVALTTGIAVVAFGLAALPPFFRTLRPDVEPSAAAIAARAEQLWMASADVIADAKIAAGLMPDRS